MTVKTNYLEDIISKGRLIDGIYYLSDMQLDRKTYLDVAKHITFLGGKWNRKKKGFVFDRTIKNISELAGNNIAKKKSLQFFETPQPLAQRLVELAEFNDSVKYVLEPSAGRGALIKEIRKQFKGIIEYCEIDATNRNYLWGISNAAIVISHTMYDFLELEDREYDRIVANPPFSKNQDIRHIQHMYSLLGKAGILVSMASKHWQISDNKREREFKSWLENVGAEIYGISEGTFKESGTMIAAVMIKIVKQEA